MDKRETNKEALRLLRDGPDDPYFISPRELWLKPEDYQTLIDDLDNAADAWNLSKPKKKKDDVWGVVLTGVVEP